MYKIGRTINGKNYHLRDTVTNEDKIVHHQRSAELLVRIINTKSKLPYQWVAKRTHR
ncbi:hypothetical protein [Halobacillus massiliensis]|uniref:hypothetical protein n=1 Tax=Halobacillus massiliensis TaxID=1926286 RepID=UPI0015C47DD9|nr:hypothetical protein [Halobacillus massiliensis]